MDQQHFASCLCRKGDNRDDLKPKSPECCCKRGFVNKGWHRPTLPHVTAVPSALAGLTSLFGMGRGGHRRYRHLKAFLGSQRIKTLRFRNQDLMLKQFALFLVSFFLPLQQPKTYIRRSNQKTTAIICSKKASGNQYYSAMLLPALHLQPINVIVSHNPIWKTHLVASFALRCFQRLSIPNVATLQYSWRHNRFTRGQSNPVLSY